MSQRILFRGGTVLTLGLRTSNHVEADVLIEDGVIAEIGTNVRARNAEVVDAAERILMPGFVDGHRHAWKSLIRGGGALRDLPGEPSAAFGPHHTPDDVYAATLLSLVSAAVAGTTTVADWADVQVTPAHRDAVLSAHADSGIRTILVDAPARWSDAEVLPPLTEAPGDHTTIASGHGDPAAGDNAESAWAAARARGQRVHAHVGVPGAAQGSVQGLAGAGLLADDVTLIHCSLLDDGDFDAISQSGAGVVLTPSTEMTHGLGYPPVQSFIDRSIGFGLGVDAEQEAPGDVFAQMRATIALQHARYFDLKLAGKAGLPNLMTTREAIRQGTILGAEALGLGAATGSLEVGKQADVLVLRTDRANIHPVNDPIGAVVWGMDTSNVDWVIAGGSPAVREGMPVADVTDLRRKANEAHARLVAASGLLSSTGGVA
ncbi:MAG: amidohydrolase family protein [Acidimicrobiia bacterium]|nr:MAG: amidohydrolase family protein [Acidimicrobiia bacterium]